MSTTERLPEVMTAQEVAEFLRISEAVVRQYAVRGTIPGRQIGEEKSQTHRLRQAERLL